MWLNIFFNHLNNSLFKPSKADNVAEGEIDRDVAERHLGKKFR